ncbi:MAG: STAS domain-containing protein [Magnetospirillum sp. WYHS-4]
MFALSDSGTGCRIDLLPVMDLRAAGPFKGILEQAIGRGVEVTIAAADVERLSTPCIQVLLAATAAMEKGGIAFRIVGPTDAFISAFDDLGLFPVIMKWKVE